MGTVRDNETDASVIEASLTVPEHFRLIVERHFTEIYAYLARRTGRDAAEDLAAECFAVAFKARCRFDRRRDSARPWLYGIATNLLRHHRRDEVRRLAAYGRVAAQEPPAQDGAEGVAVRLDASAAIRRVADAFARLDGDQRDALYLVAVAGLSYPEAAEALGIKAGTVHSRVARARSRLRDLAGLAGQQLPESEEG